MPVVNAKRFLGYTKDRKGGNLIIVPEEADAVKLVFKMYNEGMGAGIIAKKMTELGYKTGAGNTKWLSTTVLTIVKNEKYCGDLLQQKTITVDYLSHKKIKNTEVAPKYLIENNHEAIIDKETFELAVYNDVLEGATIKMINELFIQKTKVTSAIKDAIKKNVQISEAENEIKSTKMKIDEKETLINNLVDMKMKNPKFDDVIFTNKYNELKYDIEELSKELELLENQYVDSYDTSNRLNLIDSFLDEHEKQITELTPEILKSFVHKILVLDRDKVIFCVAGSKKYSDKEFNDKRFDFTGYQPIHEGSYEDLSLKKSMIYSVVIL